MKCNRLLSSSRCICTLLFLSSSLFTVSAQFLRTSYFMEGTHYRQQLNPALSPTKGYFNIPVLGSINASVNSTSLGYQDILDIIDNEDDFYTKQDFMNRLKDNNKMNVNVNTEILSAGWYKGRNFWSFNIGLRTDIGANISKNMFKFLNEMKTIDDNWRNSSYNIDKQQMNINAYSEVGVGLSRQINNRLTIGTRLKVLLGIGNLEMKINRAVMSSNLPTDDEIAKWSNPNYWNSMEQPEAIQAAEKLKNRCNKFHANLDVSAELNSSFKGIVFKENDNDDYVSELDFEGKELGIAGYGLGLDFGASYKLMDNLTVSASILDLGFINWSKSSTKIASANPKQINLQGSTFSDMIDINNHQTIINAINQLQSDANEYIDRVSDNDVLGTDMLQLKIRDAEKSRKSNLASTIVLGTEYGFFNNKFALGALSTTRFTQPNTITELTLSANYRPKNWFNASLSYSAIQSLSKSFGFGIKLGALFIGTDYMFLGKNSNSVNGFIGISVPLGGKKEY